MKLQLTIVLVCPHMITHWLVHSFASSFTIFLVAFGFGFKAYLTNRFQYVSINNHCSQLLPVESGVPQDSILGPLLFVIYINSLPDAVLHSKTLLFGDDTKCFRHIKSLTDQQLLQADLNLLSSWSEVSCLSFNPSKSVHISFSSKLPTSYVTGFVKRGLIHSSNFSTLRRHNLA